MLQEPYYTMLYVEHDLYKNVRAEMDMPVTTFGRNRKRRIELIIDAVESTFTVDESMSMSGKDIREKRQKSSRLSEMPGQISISDILNVPESGTRR